MSKTQITAEAGIPQIVITREFDAPRDLVFRAYSDPELLVQWLGPRDLAMTIHAHPTLSETVMEGAETLHGLATHIYKVHKTEGSKK